MKNILVPTDFSKTCDKAAHLAIEIATLFDAEIHFLHQIHTPVDWVKLSKTDEHKYPDTQKAIGIAKSKLRSLDKDAENSGLKSRTFLEYISDVKAISEHSHNFHHDFIITGSKGTQEYFSKQFLGSNTQKIIRDIHVPILVVKEDTALFPFKNIIFVSDFKEDMSNAFKQVVKIAEKCNSKIHLLNINTSKDFNNIKNCIAPIREFLTNFPTLKNYEMHVYNESTILKGIETFQKENEVDLVAMYTHNRSGLSNIFSKSIAENITNNSKKPVMTIHL